MIRCPSSEISLADKLLGSGAPNAPLTYQLVELTDYDGELDPATTRLTGPCYSGACSQFKDGNCAVGTHVARCSDIAGLSIIPRCPIRSECRWFIEQGRRACAGCAFVRRTLARD